MLAILSSIEGRLSGYFAFHNESLNQVILEGARTEDGQFWPVVKMQVANDRDGEWKTIGQWVNPGKLAPLVVEGTSTCKLMIDMSAFSPLVGKFKYGGVILSNGEAAWFELTDLLPPAE